MEIKDLIGKKTLSRAQLAKKHKLSSGKLKRQMAIGAKIEREHTNSDAEAREISRDHLAEIPDYYTRLKKMEKEAGVEEYHDELEAMHNANRARILKGAKEGKFWLLRSEGVERMNESTRQELIDRIIETTMSSAIGSYNTPLGVKSNDITMGRRNSWNKTEKKFAISSLLKNKSVPAPTP